MTRWFTAVAVGLTFIVLGSRDRLRFLSPGPLSRNHAVLRDRCTACHVAAGVDIVGWVRAALSSEVGGANDTLCRDCHDLGVDAARAHSRSAVEVGAASAAAASSTGLISELQALAWADEDEDRRWSCTTCHREHRGHDASVVDLDDRRCQACHRVRFNGFTDGHPEFSGRESRYAIRFDHGSHAARHYPADGARFDCVGCHVLDDGSVAMGLLSFEVSCASCHLDEILGQRRAGARGVALLTVPGLDLDVLRAASADAFLDDWPADAETEPPAMMSLLLPGAPDVSELDLLDLTGRAPSQVAAARAYAIAVLELFEEVQELGDEAVLARIEMSLGTTVGRGEREALLAGLDQRTIATARRRWSRDQQRLSSDEEPRSSAGGWHIDDADYTISYGAKGHGDRFFRGWIDILAAASVRAPVRPEIVRLLAMFVAPTAPGACGKCHRLEAPAGAPRWRRRTRSGGLTRFEHEPHLLVATDGCHDCHAMRQEAATRLDGATRLDAPVSLAGASPDFVPLRKASCTSCHNDDGAGQACLQCHRYHSSERPMYESDAVRAVP